MEGRTPSKSRRRGILRLTVAVVLPLLLVLAALVVVLVGPSGGSGDEPEETTRPSGETDRGPAAERAWRGTEPRRVRRPPTATFVRHTSTAERSSAAAVSRDEDRAVMPPGPHDPRPDGPLRPHPLTEEHARIQRENAIVASLEGAVLARDAPAIRRLIDRLHAANPTGSATLRRGYEIIADCFERHDDASRAAAQRYYDAERASTIRRQIREICLER